MAPGDLFTPNSVSLWCGGMLETSQMVKGPFHCQQEAGAFSIRLRGREGLSTPRALRGTEARGRVFLAPTAAVR